MERERQRERETTNAYRILYNERPQARKGNGRIILRRISERLLLRMRD